MIFLNIASGVILVLLGMRHLRRGLDLLFGNKLVGWLQKMTRNRVQGFLAGIVAGSMAPSSTGDRRAFRADAQSHCAYRWPDASRGAWGKCRHHRGSPGAFLSPAGLRGNLPNSRWHL